MHNRYAKKGNGVSAQLLLFSKNRTSKYKKTKAIITLLLLPLHISILSRKEVLPDLLDLAKLGQLHQDPFQDSPERRCSSRTFRYGYLVTT